MKPAIIFLLTLSFSDQIQNIEQTYASTPALQAEFVQKTYVPLLEETVTRSGRLFYKKGGKIRIEYAAEPMAHYISDGQILWIVYPEEKRRETYYLKDSGLPEEALNFLTELGSLRKYFQVAPGQREGGPIVLKPKKKSTYRQLEAAFDKNHFLQELTIHSLSGNRSRYRFFNLQTPKNLPDTLFTFSAPPRPDAKGDH